MKNRASQTYRFLLAEKQLKIYSYKVLTSITMLMLFYNAPIQAQKKLTIPKNYKLEFSEKFNNSKSLKAISFNIPDQWLISKNGVSGNCLKLKEAQVKNTPFSTPSILAIINQLEVKDFILEIEVLQEGKNFDLRDFCFLWGYRDSLHYQYCRVTSKTQRGENNIYSFQNTNPQIIGERLNDGILWGMNQWHTVRIERENNKVEVFVDDELMLTTNNDNNTSGAIGFGTSNDAGKFDNLKIWTPQQ